MPDVTCYRVVRTTTEQLQATLNNAADDGEAEMLDRSIVQIQHVGGRDWVVIVKYLDSEVRRASLLHEGEKRAERRRAALNFRGGA